MTTLDEATEAFLATVSKAYGIKEPEARIYVRAVIAALREPDDAVKRAGFDPFIAAHDPMFSKNEPCGPIWKAMINEILR